MGCGAVPLWTLIPAHLEEVTERRWSSVYMSVYYGINAVGPAVGFLVRVENPRNPIGFL